MEILSQYCLALLVLCIAAVPLGGYIYKVMEGERTFMSPLLRPCENFIYRLVGSAPDEDMSWKEYAFAALAFSSVSLVFLAVMLMAQGVLPLNPERLDGLSWHLAFNTAVSFVTNTNWQSYNGEKTLGYFAQSMGLTVQNFVSAAVGIAVLFAFLRGFTRVGSGHIGSFWKDTTRALLYVLLPLCLIMSVALTSQGVMQNFKSYESVDLVESVTASDGSSVTKQIVKGQSCGVSSKNYATAVTTSKRYANCGRL